MTEVGTEIEVVEAEVVAPAPTTLFRTNDPTEVVEQATAVATALASVIEAQKLYAMIGGRKHVTVEGWTLLGSMLGVFPVCTWTRRIEGGWEARVEARTIAGALVGAAEAECLTSEKSWKSRDDYALRSMAQTRATSKALRLPLGFVVTLGGYAATPAEEMPRDEERREGGLGPMPVPRSWAKVREWYDKHGGPGAWELAEAFSRAAMYHLYGTLDSKALTKEERAVVLQKAAGAVVWLAENENTPFGSTPSVAHYQRAWAHVLDGAVLEVPDAKLPEVDVPFAPELPEVDA